MSERLAAWIRSHPKRSLLLGLGLVGVGLALGAHAFAWVLAHYPTVMDAPLSVRAARVLIPFLAEGLLGLALLVAGFVVLDVRAGKGLREALWENLDADHWWWG